MKKNTLFSTTVAYMLFTKVCPGQDHFRWIDFTAMHLYVCNPLTCNQEICTDLYM